MDAILFKSVVSKTHHFVFAIFYLSSCVYYFKLKINPKEISVYKRHLKRFNDTDSHKTTKELLKVIQFMILLPF